MMHDTLLHGQPSYLKLCKDALSLDDGTALASSAGAGNEVKHSIDHIVHHHSNGCGRYILVAAGGDGFHLTNNGLQLPSKPGVQCGACCVLRVTANRT